MKKITLSNSRTVLALVFCFFLIIPVSKTFGFGTDIGALIWTRDSANITIIHQLTRMGPVFNTNGIIILNDTGEKMPVFGTAFLDTSINKLVIGASAVGTSGHSTARLELELATLNGTFILFPGGGGPPTTDTVTFVGVLP